MADTPHPVATRWKHLGHATRWLLAAAFLGLAIRNVHRARDPRPGPPPILPFGPPAVSPALRSQVASIRDRFAEALAANPAPGTNHVGMVASWCVNLMVDAAYQDAIAAGLEPDAKRARAQVLEALRRTR